MKAIEPQGVSEFQRYWYQRFGVGALLWYWVSGNGRVLLLLPSSFLEHLRKCGGGGVEIEGGTTSFKSRKNSLIIKVLVLSTY